MESQKIGTRKRTARSSQIWNICLTNGGWSGSWYTGEAGSDAQTTGSILLCFISPSLGPLMGIQQSLAHHQAPRPHFLRCYKSLLDLVTRSDWSISTAPRPHWKILGLSKGGMAFVHPTVTDHGADRGVAFTSRAHLQFMVISTLLHGFLLRHLSPLTSLLLLLFIYVCLGSHSSRS